MKSLKYRLKKQEVTISNTDWNKYDERLMKAVERGEVDKVAAVLSKKGIVPTKLDVEGRSAFHLAATRGHLDCLNLILGHSVDITATDATGKNALHLAARNGQSLSVQKLLQHNCPVGNVDLQGRTALHDAVMAGCSSSVKLLCDSGAAVNASDFDGRTPLVLATQMCHTRICQLLLERGANVAVRDKQKKTALILGCEYACKDAVEVLLKNGADVLATDSFGHDGYHYARHSKNQELAALVKNAVESATKAKETVKMEQKMRQRSVEMNAEAEANIRDQIIYDLERQNESQQETLRKFHQEQRVLVDKVNLLQKQLSQEKSNVDDIQKEREQLRTLLSAREDESVRAVETVKVQLKSPLGDYSGQSVIKGKDNILVKQSHSLDSAQILQSSAPLRSVSRPLELSRSSVSSAGGADSLWRELEGVKRRLEASEEEVGRLTVALAHKTQECEEMAQNLDTTKRDSDRQVRELEDALSDVQKRMVDSETKVKQLQAHVVAVKEHLSSQLVEDLRAQLQDIKAKYEGASTEVGRVRNHLKQSEKALEEYKKSEGLLAVETERLSKELLKAKRDKEEMTLTLVDMESLVKEMEVSRGSMVPGERFDNMKNLLTNAVDEKEKQLAELREDYDRTLEEVAELHRELDSQRTRAGRNISQQEHERVKAALEEQNVTLKKKLADVTSKSQALIREVEMSEKEKGNLSERIQDLNKKIQSQCVPLKTHEEMKRSLSRTIEDLNQQLAEAAKKSSQAEVELQTLQVERATLCENVTNLQSRYIPPERFDQEVGTLSSHNASLRKELEVLQRKYQDKDKELCEMVAENTALKNSLQAEFVPRGEYEKMETELGGAVNEAKAKISKMEKECKESEEELWKVKEECALLNKKLQGSQVALQKDYVSLRDHEEMKSKLNRAVSEAEFGAKEASLSCQSAQEETNKLHKEIAEQKKELDMIQKAIQSKFVPVAVVEEKENSFKSTVKDLTERLAAMQEMYNQDKTEGECHKQENEKLKVELMSVQERLKVGFVATEKYQQVEDMYKGRVNELTQKLRDLEQQYLDVTLQRTELEEQNAQCNVEIEDLQNKLESECVLRVQFEAMQQSLNGSIQQAREENEKVTQAYRLEVERAGALEKELKNHSNDTTLLAEHIRARELLEKEVANLKLALRKEHECNAQRAEDIASLQSELTEARRALDGLQNREVDELVVLRAEKQKFEVELENLVKRMSNLAKQYEKLHGEAAQARADETRARTETEALQAKSFSIENEIKELKKRYDDSLNTIGDLQKRIQKSSEQTEMKDKKITELLTDVERLKQALNGLSQLAYAGNAPSKRQTQHIDTLQSQVKSLQQQLADAERQHREVVSIYRTHLLSAAQGHMDEDVQAALLQIIRMRQQFVC